MGSVGQPRRFFIIPSSLLSGCASGCTSGYTYGYTSSHLLLNSPYSIFLSIRPFHLQYHFERSGWGARLLLFHFPHHTLVFMEGTIYLLHSDSPTSSPTRKRSAHYRVLVTPRDEKLLTSLATARYMTTPQIHALFWNNHLSSSKGSLKACQRRLKKLVEAKLIRCIEQPVKRGQGSLPYVYALDAQGAAHALELLPLSYADLDIVCKNQECYYPFLSHILATNEVRIALAHACAQNNITLATWIDEKILRKNRPRANHIPFGDTVVASVIPDAYCALVDSHRGTTASFCLEVDNGTAIVTPTKDEKRGWGRKIRGYIALYESGEYARRFDTKTLQVLIVTTSQERLQHLMEATATITQEHIFLFTTFNQLASHTVLQEPIWISHVNDAPISLLAL